MVFLWVGVDFRVCKVEVSVMGLWMWVVVFVVRGGLILIMSV